MRLPRRLLAILAFGVVGLAHCQEAPLPSGARARLGNGGVLQGEPGASAVISPDGKFLAVPSQWQNVLVDPSTGKEIRKLEFDPQGGFGAQNLFFSPDGSLIAGINFDAVRVWDVANGKLLHKLKKAQAGGTSAFRNISFSADNQFLAVGPTGFGNDRNEIALWEIKTAKIVQTLQGVHTNGCRVALSRDGAILVNWGQQFGIAEQARTIQFWNAKTGKELHRVKTDGPIRQVALAPHGKTLAAASGSATFHLFDVQTGKETSRFAGQRGNLNVLQFSPDGKLVLAGDAEGIVQAWNADTGDRLTLPDSPHGKIASFFFPAKDKVHALGVLGQALFTSDILTGKIQSPLTGHQNPIAALGFTPDGKQLLSVSGDGALIYWDPATGKERRRLQLRADQFNRLAPIPQNFAGAFSPSTKFLATVHAFGITGVRLWNLETGGVLCDFDGARSGPLGLAFAAHSDTLAVSGEQHTVSLWNVKQGREMFRLGSIPKNVVPNNVTYTQDRIRLAVSPDGTRVASSANYHDRIGNRQVAEFVLWEAGTGKELKREKNPSAALAAGAVFSGDGKLLAAVDRGIVLLDADTGHELRRLEAGTGLASGLAFAPDSRSLAVAIVTNKNVTIKIGPNAFMGRSEQEHTLDIYETATGRLREKLPGHKSAINCLAFSPDGATLATGGADTMTLLWELGPTKALDNPDFDDAWNTLSADDAKKAWATIRRLIASPAESVRFLQGHLKPHVGAKIDLKDVEKLVRDLDSQVFSIRENAQQSLERLGELAVAPLKAALQGEPSVEARRRAETILRKLAPNQISATDLRNLRALEILERIATPEARTLVTSLAAGSPSQLTREAQATLTRLTKATSAPPP